MVSIGIMLIFGSLTLRNIKQNHRRIANVKTNQNKSNVRGSQRQQSTLTALMLIQLPFYLYTLTGKLFREALFRRFHNRFFIVVE
ncbi:unnamed protein product [Rotaria sp. Silwood1]|nr:unnamed protein product [Rotaria sp. Silwood1]CAF3549318.1 unnamed protein product [Rotaria sp. Silwood1]